MYRSTVNSTHFIIKSHFIFIKHFSYSEAILKISFNLHFRQDQAKLLISKTKLKQNYTQKWNLILMLFQTL